MNVAVDRKRIYHKRDRLRQLRAFCRAAHFGSITKAADSLGVSHPSVSLQVRELENELETFLFDRSGSGIVLTRAGERLFALAEPLVRGMDEMSIAQTDQFNEAIPDHLQLAASVVGAACVLPRYIRQFRDLYPNVRVTVRNCLLREGLNLLLDDKVEFALGGEGSLPGRFSRVPRDDVVRNRAHHGLDHPLAGCESVSPEEASAWPAIVPAAGTYSRQFGETAARQFGIDVNAVIEVGGWGPIKRYVESGLGISIVPSMAIMETDQLAVIPLNEYFPQRSFGVFTRRAKYLTPPARKLLSLMIPNFPDPLVPSPRSDMWSSGRADV